MTDFDWTGSPQEFVATETVRCDCGARIEPGMTYQRLVDIGGSSGQFALLNPPGWVHKRPATTVMGDTRIWPPGHKVNAADIKARRDHLYTTRAGNTALRLTISQLGVLQSFPVDYPWQGNKTQQAKQVGNAVPPLLAAAMLSALI
jgi:site-specific DNA-cytosine methylase